MTLTRDPHPIAADVGPPVGDLSGAREAVWVLQAQRRDPAAFARLIDCYERRLLYYLRRFVPDADRVLDVLQDVWLTVFRKLPELRSADAFRTWLYRIAHDRVAGQVRADVRRERAYEAARSHHRGATADDAGDPGEACASAENAALVHRALPALSVDHREVLALRFVEDMTVEEIAAVTRAAAGTVKSRLHYAKLALRAELERLSHA